jgi:hypothetical protein
MKVVTDNVTDNVTADPLTELVEAARIEESAGDEMPALMEQPEHVQSEPTEDVLEPRKFPSVADLEDLSDSVTIAGFWKGRFAAQVASKWVKTAVLRQDARIAKHIPDTRRFTPGNLSSMLSVYGKVILKPVVGSGGLGVIMVSRTESGYWVRYRQTVRRFRQFSALLAAVRRMRRRRRYLVQRGIHLATINGRPIDYRVKVVKEGRFWITKAMVGRLARRGLFVTNLCRGGTQLSSAEGIRRSLSASAVRHKKNEMRRLTRLCTHMLERHFPRIGQLGFDYGIDRDGNIWILEVNTRPH